ncbi:unnamed protein product [Rotaria sp. Silwood2]|nr:unnamed protein product [Rotaria sp. Silwood2]
MNDIETDLQCFRFSSTTTRAPRSVMKYYRLKANESRVLLLITYPIFKKYLKPIYYKHLQLLSFALHGDRIASTVNGTKHLPREIENNLQLIKNSSFLLDMNCISSPLYQFISDLQDCKSNPSIVSNNYQVQKSTSIIRDNDREELLLKFDAHKADTSTRTFEKVGLLIGLNQASQYIGSVLVSPLVKRWRIQFVLSSTIFILALSTAIFMIIDVATGGRIKPKGFKPEHKNDFNYYGNYCTDTIIPIYCLAGITLGMVESIRRVIPANIVGGSMIKLRKMNAVVHVFYELSGVSGALITALVLIP